jgi:uncharacterized protein YndB with AHSA1/START domain
MSDLPYRLDRTVTIRASRDLVFRYFTDSDRWAAWWGAGSTIEPRAGGAVYIRHPGGVESLGEVVAIDPPERIVLTYGFASGSPIPPGSSLVTIRLEAEGTATRLHLVHEFPNAAARDEHVQGWRYQLSVFSNVVSDELHADAAGLVDAWFGAWSEADAGTRSATFARIASPDVRFSDRVSLVDGVADLVAHVGAAQRFMPGVSLARSGGVRHCQGTILADWIWHMPDGAERARGTNVFTMGGDGRIEAVVGLTTPRQPDASRA